MKTSLATVAALAVALGAVAAPAFGPRALDVAELQPLVSGGDPAEALRRIDAALEHDPDNARLLYNRGVAAYASGQFGDSLVAFDRAETGGSRKIARLARFQKGNAEYRLGDAMRRNNLDETIAHWKQSLEDYRDVLKESPGDEKTVANHEFVKARLLEILMRDAAKHAKAAQDPRNSTAEKVDHLRNAFDKYRDASQIDPRSQEAKDGEKQSREQLAQALAKEGQRLANQPLQPRFNPREPALPDYDTRPLEEGVGMLEDANRLVPEQPEIKKDLDQAKEKLADADVQRAKRYMELEERTPWAREKLAVLRMGRELTEKALDQVQNYKPAEETRDEINRRLAQVHEDEGDAQSQLAQHANLEQQAMSLSQALDHFQQANDLQPAQSQLPPKIKKTSEQLAKALDKLADKLMQSPKGQESLEQGIARLEGADQALNELQGLQPSKETQAKSEQVSQQLDGMRQKAAQQGQKPGPDGQPQLVPGQNGPGGQMVMQGPPMDTRPRINTPGMKGEWNSRAMNAGKDY
ncbi:MAG: hypothetical protein DVB31_11270 [Verrucomicrobia bacterium]|nr:MAG: hypothetical protein DVB31_11270 [Verrucomicrobiota bacterium]